MSNLYLMHTLEHQALSSLPRHRTTCLHVNLACTRSFTPNQTDTVSTRGTIGKCMENKIYKAYLCTHEELVQLYASNSNSWIDPGSVLTLNLWFYSASCELKTNSYCRRSTNFAMAFFYYDSIRLEGQCAHSLDAKRSPPMFPAVEVAVFLRNEHCLALKAQT